MQFEARSRPQRRLGLTPLIDVVFLLLIFFMLASTLTGERTLGLEVAGASRAADTEAEPLRVLLSADGQVSLAGAPVALARLTSALREALAVDAGHAVRVVPDPDASLQRIVDVLERTEAAGAAHVTLERVAPSP